MRAFGFAQTLRKMSTVAQNRLNLPICLTPEEDRLFELLRSVTVHSSPTTTVRVAGGWVRDKVLGRQSGDIDVALDNMTGSRFAELVNTYLASTGQDTHRVAVIQANPGTYSRGGDHSRGRD